MTPLDLPTSRTTRGPKRWAVIALLAGVLVVAVVSIAWQLTPGEDPTVVKMPDAYHFRCPRCEHRWSADFAEVTRYFGGGQPTALSPVDCPSCGEKKAAFLMARCPWCGKHYIHRHLLEPTSGRPGTDICPHCKKDTMKWRK